MTTVADAPDQTPSAGTGSTALDLILRFRALGLLLALAALIVITASVNPRFLGAQSIRDLLFAAAVTVLLAAGMTVVVLTRGIDLSVGSTLGLSAYLTATALSSGTPVPLALLVGIGAGAACGAVNGAIVHFGKVPPLVATLGTLYVFRGIVYFTAGGSRVNASDLPRGFLDFGSGAVLGVPYLFIISALVLAAVAVFLSDYRAGRDLYALGSNPEAARQTGLPAGRRLMTAYVLCGALAGLGGVLYAARFGTVDASAGYGMELNIVAAVVVGGVAIFGGSGTVLGAGLGALLLTVISNALPVLRIDQFWQQAIVGALILAAIALDRLVGLRAARALRRKASHVD
ncbi:ABC transporter permease [Glycomyces buryatensis]|uniref:Autoinducer 2 import system permease protein LsrC n=1 Tax=Glycomyces buryatensis TaxID=2570927 RepID=A0A4S8PR05_9ACTN|nr:ABC transporter permease [Glycomyces buryatensis]THV33630.1 ABC transporter permease [Glycomyces buryatensis]